MYDKQTPTTLKSYLYLNKLKKSELYKSRKFWFLYNYVDISKLQHYLLNWFCLSIRLNFCFFYINCNLIYSAYVFESNHLTHNDILILNKTYLSKNLDINKFYSGP